MAAIANIHPHMKTPLKAYYLMLLEKGYPEYQARHALSRRVAVIALGVLKSKKPFELGGNWISYEQFETSRQD